MANQQTTNKQTKIMTKFNTLTQKMTNFDIKIDQFDLENQNLDGKSIFFRNFHQKTDRFGPKIDLIEIST